MNSMQTSSVESPPTRTKPNQTGAMAALAAALAVYLMAPDALLAQERNPERDAYFGETHVHTRWS